MSKIAQTPKAPYYAVIFTSTTTENDNGYAETADIMQDLAKKRPGYLGMESATDEYEITVSYWDSIEAIKGWKAHVDHQMAQKRGRAEWYSSYKVRIAKVERDYGWAL